MRPTPIRVHRLKAAFEVSLPESCLSSPSADDPEEPFSFLQSGHSDKLGFCIVDATKRPLAISHYRPRADFGPAIEILSEAGY